MDADRVDLAHEPDFVLGRLIVSPVRRALLRDDGTQEVIEHRVMQVLIALTKARGGIVTRDELTRSCWEGRVVGEDAINRVISRLRKAAEGIGANSFKIETITKIGYRLIDEAAPAGMVANGSVDVRRPEKGPLSRRTLLGGAAAAGAVLVGGALLYRQTQQPAASPEVASLMEQGVRAIMQDTREGQSQAVGLYRRMTEIAPDNADGWGMLGLAYGIGASSRPRAEANALRERAEEAANRSFVVDPENGYGHLARAIAQPKRGSWMPREREMRTALEKRPGNDVVLSMLGVFLGSVGRLDEAVAQFDQIKMRPRTPSQYFNHIQSLWGTGRVEQLDRLMDEAAELYPSQFAIWFSRFYIALHSGRPGAAIALGDDVESRPMGIPADEFDDIMAVAHAVRDPSPRSIEAVMKTQMQRAHQGSGMAENAIQFACKLGRLDEAFAIMDAYYFGRGFTVPDVRFTPSQGSYTTIENRQTRFLFQPSTRPARADPRFKQLVDELGLERYWRDAGVQPDYRRG